MARSTALSLLTLGSKGHEELMKQFEALKPGRIDREKSKELWKKGYVYADGQVNALFVMFRHGAAYGITIGDDR